MQAEPKTKIKVIKTRVNARLSFKYLCGNGFANMHPLKQVEVYLSFESLESKH